MLLLQFECADPWEKNIVCLPNHYLPKALYSTLLIIGLQKLFATCLSNYLNELTSRIDLQDISTRYNFNSEKIIHSNFKQILIL